MPNLDQIEQKVNNLIEDESLSSEFRDAFKDIEEAGKITTNTEIARLRNILSNFRGKLPNKVVLKPTRAKAKDLADELMLNTLKQRLDRIEARNEALTNLTDELNVQIAKGNSDANRLKEIKSFVDKATETVNVVKNLIDQLTATDATIKSNLKALIDALDGLSRIFKPSET